MAVLPNQPALQPEKDAMGKAIQDYFKTGNKDIEVTVYSDFSDPDVIPAELLFRMDDDLPELEQVAIEHCEGEVLDIGAGSGSHALMLQKAGFDVTAMDVSPLSIEVMQQRGVKNTLQENIFYYKEKQYDTLLMLMNGIGLVGTLDGLKHFLEHVKTLLKPGGQLIFDSSDIIYLYQDDDGSYLIDIAGEYYGQLEYWMEYGEAKGDKFGWLYVSFPVMEEYANEAGFNAEVLYTGDHHDYLARLTLQS
ncbi:class I SAM-dependent methyltransferase [Limibacter armeniacum]|uniref:class I SAM-dependent methyltransferase n=1 Tax=Limibacter armeniacum TaxID=466084 RepID=UPI002FE638C2